MLSPTLRSTLPLAALTALSLLAMDLHLPAVPVLRGAMAADAEGVQATIAAFFAALAVSQLLWGMLADRFGLRTALAVGMLVFAVSSVACALSGHIGVLVAWRAVQGFGAGAAMVVVPALLRHRFGEQAFRAIAFVGAVESLVPAVAPVIGSLLVSSAGWQSVFWVLAVMAGVLLPVALMVPGPARPGRDDDAGNDFRAVLADAAYVRNAGAYAFSFASLMVFVAGAPHLLLGSPNNGQYAFAIMQAAGVAAFLVAVSRTAVRASSKEAAVIAARAAPVQLAAAGALTLLAAVDAFHVFAVSVTWCVFCAAFGCRGPVLFSRALEVPRERAARAVGVLMFCTLSLSALLVQAAAWTLDGSPWITPALSALALVASIGLKRHL